MVDALGVAAEAKSKGDVKVSQRLFGQDQKRSDTQFLDGERGGGEDEDEDEEMLDVAQEDESSSLTVERDCAQKQKNHTVKCKRDKFPKKKQKKKHAKKQFGQEEKVSEAGDCGGDHVEEKTCEVRIDVPNHRGVNPGFLCGAFCDKFAQSWPPERPMSALFPDGIGPAGEIMEYTRAGRGARVNGDELRALENITEDKLRKLRLAAECHRQVRGWSHSWIKPGILLSEMCERIENKVRQLVEEAGLDAGMGFPTGCSLDNVAAHYTPNPGDETRLGEGNVMKVDFGTQIDGYIIDSAWTVSFLPKFDPLLEAVRDATETGIRAAGIDARLGEVGAAIQEAMESHEVEIQGKVYPVKCCRNLQGHSIERHRIHGTKFVPIIGSDDATKMEAGELFAIETFGTTGRGYVVEGMECSHYMLSNARPSNPIRLASAKKLLSHINRTFSTLPFCRRWLERDDGGSFFTNGTSGKQTRYLGGLKNLCDLGFVDPSFPLLDVPSSYVAQYEHTIFLRPTCKEVLSRGDDY